MLARRRIEAEILKHVHDMLKETHGVDVAGKIIADAVRKSSMPQAAEFATKSWRQQLDADVRRSSGPLDRRRRVGNRTSRSRPRRATSSASRAGRYAEMYREMGLGEIGHLLSCQRGATFCEGYDKRLKLRRTQTIMQGRPIAISTIDSWTNPDGHEQGAKVTPAARRPWFPAQRAGPGLRGR